MNPLTPAPAIIPLNGSMEYGLYLSNKPRKKLKGYQKLWKQNTFNKNKYKNHKK